MLRADHRSWNLLILAGCVWREGGLYKQVCDSVEFVGNLWAKREKEEEKVRGKGGGRGRGERDMEREEIVEGGGGR